MILREGNMLDSRTRIEFVRSTDKPLVVLVTTNGVINKAGEVVMGRGAALMLKKLIPSFPLDLAKVLRSGNYHLADSDGAVYYKYGLCIPSLSILQAHPTQPVIYFGAFQSKKLWYEKSSLEIIKYSVEKLKLLLNIYDINVWLNYPGINNGKLTEEEVYPLIKDLPDNVTIWKYQ